MVLEGRTFERLLGHERRALVDRIGALKRDWESSHFYHVSLLWEESYDKEAGSHQTFSLPAW